MLGQGQLAPHGPLGGSGEDLVTPRTAGEIGHRVMSRLDVGPEDSAKTPAESSASASSQKPGLAVPLSLTRDIAHIFSIRVSGPGSVATKML